MFKNAPTPNSPPPSPAGIALGSNLGDRLANLRRARDLLLLRTGSPGCLSAPVYLTAPFDCPPGSPDFYNTVVEISFAGSPADLLALTQSIQREMGRPPSGIRNAPRVIDLDLLYLGTQTVSTPDLGLPHPRLTRRAFVLRPLADIRPALVLPHDTLSIAGHLLALPADESPPTLVQSAW